MKTRSFLSMKEPIPIIDLFAGPGGLGEGFSNVKTAEGTPAFEIKLSIEKDQNAHKTLVWRSFYRKFVNAGKPLPQEYYDAYRETDIDSRERIIESALNGYEEGKEAQQEARKIELGHEHWPEEKIDELIKSRLGDSAKPWVLIGGPPCQAYSLAGRSRRGAESRKGLDPTDARVFLYKEYLRIIEAHNPSVFVMENVKGLLSGQVNGKKVFDLMKEDLALGGRYHLHSFVRPARTDRDFLIECERFGVPQKRHRVIILGIRKGLDRGGEFLEEKEMNTVKSVIGDLPELRSVIGRTEKEVSSGSVRSFEKQRDSTKAWSEQISRFLQKLLDDGLEIGQSEKIKTQIQESQLEAGGEFLKSSRLPKCSSELRTWYTQPDKNQVAPESVKGVANHQSRSHLDTDLLRYLFASSVAQRSGVSPKLDDFQGFANYLMPKHRSAATNKFADRFRVQLANSPATTITSHISKDGHYFIHFDPAQCRSLTVREAARIQTFPDNYLFRGSRTAQFHQVGNAVPPFLANQIAKIVFNIVSGKTGS